MKNICVRISLNLLKTIKKNKSNYEKYDLIFIYDLTYIKYTRCNIVIQ